jgi:hypothetical protein
MSFLGIRHIAHASVPAHGVLSSLSAGVGS